MSLADEKVKRKNKQAGNLGRARVLGGKSKGSEALEEVLSNEINKLWCMAISRDELRALGFLRIDTDLFTYEISIIAKNTKAEARKKALDLVNSERDFFRAFGKDIFTWESTVERRARSPKKRLSLAKAPVKALPSRA